MSFLKIYNLNDEEDYHIYEPSSYSALVSLFDEIQLNPQDIVVDFGCGLGRVLFYCNQRFWCRVKGIEIDEEVYIIGGARVFEQAIHIAHRLCLTVIEDTPKEADTFFPEYKDWKEVSRISHHKDERNAYDYAFIDYIRPTSQG